MNTLTLQRADGTRFRIENPHDIALRFFREDPSSAYDVTRNGYDAWIQHNRDNVPWRNAIVPRDIQVINGSNMHMRSPMKAWQAFATGAALPWLTVIDNDWSLSELDGSAWQEARDRLLAAVRELLQSKGIAIAGATKILHMKRPCLVPILDSYVGQVLGTPKPESHKSRQVDWAAAMFDLLRSQLRDNAAVIASVTRYLAEQGLVRFPVRVLDALLWSAMPGSPFYGAMRITER